MIAISKENLSFDELLKMAQASKSSSPEDIMGAVQNKVPADKMSEIKKVLGDKKALEDLLKSEQAQQLLRRFKK